MMSQSKPLISIENVVVTATIDQRLDLKDITKKFPEVEWRPELFPGDENLKRRIGFKILKELIKPL